MNPAIGNIVGPQFFLTSQSPHYPLGIFAMLVCFIIMAVTGVVYWFEPFQSNLGNNTDELQAFVSLRKQKTKSRVRSTRY
jgi:uncharacterized membrane protein YdbT with pleckstrin-like domain